MGYMIVGFILGVAVSWFWQRQFSDVPVFQKLMQKELAANGQLGSLTVLKKRLESMENKLAELEKPEGETSANRDISTEEESPASAPARSGDRNRALNNVVRQIRPREKVINRDRVLKLWNEGNHVSEIASRTRMGKGEIELIISMQERIKGQLMQKNG